MRCPNCKKEVVPVECGRKKASNNYDNVHYCCPYCGTHLTTKMEQR